jgi:hypothetical protein
MNKQLFTFRIGKVYHGHGRSHPFEIVNVDAYDVQGALNMAANYLRPNHMQTLTVMGQPKVTYKQY